MAEYLSSEKEAQYVAALKGEVEGIPSLNNEQIEEFSSIVNGAKGEELNQDEAAALIASLGPEVETYLRLNVVGDPSKIPVDQLRGIAMQAGAGRGVDLDMGVQSNMGVMAGEVGLGKPTDEQAPQSEDRMQGMVDKALVASKNLDPKDVSTLDVLSASPSATPTVASPSKNLEAPAGPR